MIKSPQKITELERTAYHEAGHAVMAYLLKRKFHFITIDPKRLDGNTGGLVQLVHAPKLSKNLNCGGPNNRALTEKQIKILLSGEVAYGLFAGRKNWERSSDDVQACLGLADSQCGDEEESSAYLNWLLLSVRNELHLPHNWICVRALAEVLMKKKTISYAKTREIIQIEQNKQRVDLHFV
jgi:ATP-dependent Zn protease